MAYCNTTTDLVDVYPRLSDFKMDKELVNWDTTSGQSYTYHKADIGYVALVTEDDLAMTVKTSVAEVEATAGTYWNDTDNDILYIHPTDDGASTDYTYEMSLDWDTLLSDCRNEAMQMMDAWLNKIMITPIIARDTKDHATDDYEFPLKRSCAALTCYLVMNRLDPGNEEALKLFKVAWNPDTSNNPLDEGEIKGFINMYLDGDMVRQDDVSPRESGNFNLFPTSGNTTAEPGLIVEGNYEGSTFQIWLLTITTGGAPGTAKYKLSLDNGTTDTYTDQDTLKSGSNVFVALSQGLRAHFVAATYTANDTWTIEVYPQDSTLEKGSKINSFRLTRT